LQRRAKRIKIKITKTQLEFVEDSAEVHIC